MSDRCPFCNLQDVDPRLVAYVGRDVAIIRPLRPVTMGHRLVLPRIHTENIGTCPTDVLGVVMATAGALVNALALDGLDSNVITSTGLEALQTVFHFHAHVIPRRTNDRLALPWPQPLQGAKK
jgi:histidine triad (HIT) family protein